MTTDVLIIGGGPNGLLLACELALAGVRPVVLERLPRPATEPRANGLVGRVVEALDRRGLHARLSGTDAGPARLPGFQFGGLPLRLSTLDDHALYVLPIPQRRMESLLRERATELGVELRPGHELVALDQDDERVHVEVAGPDGTYRTAARFLVGADGAHSMVRKQSGIDFPGTTDRGFVGRAGRVAVDGSVVVPGTGELDVAGVGRFRPATFTRTETGMFAFGAFEPGVYTIATHEWTDEPGEDTATMPIEELRDSVRRVLGGDVPMSVREGTDPGLRRRVGANSRQADRYRQGRVLLVGDAAHVHSAVGGPGLNLGLQDVLNLGWKLAAEINGWAPAGLLDTYQSERHPAGRRVMMHTRAQLALLAPGPNVTALRELVTELLGDATTTRRVVDLMSGAELRYAMPTADHPLAGGWMPDLALRTATGPAQLAELLRTGRPLLLDLADRADLADAAKPWSDRVDVVSATATAERPADAVLIRPDGYVAWATGPADPAGPATPAGPAGPANPAGSAEALRHALTVWFGAPV